MRDFFLKKTFQHLLRMGDFLTLLCLALKAFFNIPCISNFTI
jgi:hypothetical protein